jgi:hypothetical protein
MYICEYVCVYVCKYEYVYMCMYVCIYIFMYVCMYIFMYAVFFIYHLFDVWSCQSELPVWYMLEYLQGWIIGYKNLELSFLFLTWLLLLVSDCKHAWITSWSVILLLYTTSPTQDMQSHK